jgi:hypothetical protein
MTDNCIKKFEPLQDLFCFSCSCGEFYSVNSSKKIVYICDILAHAIWESKDTNNPTIAYDKCGFKVPVYLSDLTKKNYMVPSQVFLKFLLY